MSPILLDPADVRRILTALVEELALQDGVGSVFVIGGAAMSLLHDERRSTTDIDGWIVSTADVASVVRRVQARWGLEDDWFSAHAQGLLPPIAGAEMFAPMHSVGGVTLYVAEPRALLAMKLFAARAKDQDDIEFLVRHCGIGDLPAAERLFEQFYPGEGLSDRAIARVRAALAEEARQGWMTPT